MTAAYLEKYFECVEFMPLELQRCVSELREVDRLTQGLYGKIESLRCAFVKAVESGDGRQQQILFKQLQECMLEARETGSTKLEISAQLLDIVESHSQSLELKSKSLDNPRHEDFYHNSRYSYSSSVTSTSKADSPSSFMNGAGESKPAKRTSSSKRPRQANSSASVEKNGEDHQVGGAKDGNNGRSRENSLGGVASGGGSNGSANNSKPPKKKIKTVKKKAIGVKEKDSSGGLSSSSHVPMPDLTSQPLDPNEPTYCLCQQVSFGEMIGCDNDECPIEWFHFQCVNLTSKPKGKWYCPQCTQERKNRTSK